MDIGSRIIRPPIIRLPDPEVDAEKHYIESKAMECMDPQHNILHEYCTHRVSTSLQY